MFSRAQALPWNGFLKTAASAAKQASRFPLAPVESLSMLRRFTDHPASLNETYLQHMAMAFGFGGRMLLGSLACFVHGLLPWLCLTRGSDTIRALHRRMVTHRVVRSAQAD
jgi:hypothetical protein